MANTAPAGAFTETLSASFGATTGNATNNNGTASGIVAGTNNTSALQVGVNTSAAGARTGMVTVNLTSNEVTGSGLGNTPLTPQQITVSGNVYNAAQGSATPSPSINLGNVRVGGTLGQALTVSNTAPGGAFSEDLNAAFGANGGNATSTGSITGLLAGSNNNSAMTVGLTTGTAGAKTGTVTVNYTTAGAVAGVSNGLAPAAVGSQGITLNGTVYQLASGLINTAPLNFGTVQVGQAVAQTLSITNTAPAGAFSEDLNASFGASSGTSAALISGAGSITGLLAGATNTSGMTVSVNTGAAGTVTGAIAVNFVSAGAVDGTSNGLGTLGVGSVNYGVSGLIQATVINTASPVINNSRDRPGQRARRNDTSPTPFVSVTNQTTTAPQAALNASISGNAPLTASGSFTLLDAGGHQQQHAAGGHEHRHGRLAQRHGHGGLRLRCQQRRQLCAELPVEPAQPERHRHRRGVPGGPAERADDREPRQRPRRRDPEPGGHHRQHAQCAGGLPGRAERRRRHPHGGDGQRWANHQSGRRQHQQCGERRPEWHRRGQPVRQRGPEPGDQRRHHQRTRHPGPRPGHRHGERHRL